MSKRKTAILSIASLLFLITSTVSNCRDSGIAPNNTWTVAEGITLRFLQDSYPPNTKAMTLVLENRTDSVMSYGRGWYFEKFKHGKWRRLRFLQQNAFTMEGYLLYDHDRKTF
ncbi:MAG: hypothetical protein FWG10_10765, partial [Eubacteriaceae bacterium]|nr:hypothetical protein [Eubacteriaceae bacterium]